jgi:hypothetical protein
MLKNKSVQNCFKIDAYIGFILMIPTKLEWVQMDIVCERYRFLYTLLVRKIFVDCIVRTMMMWQVCTVDMVGSYC